MNIYPDSLPFTMLAMGNPPVANGVFQVNSGVAIQRQRLPTDPVGETRITLTGLRPGSDVSVFSRDSSILDARENVTGSVTFTLNRYLSGAPNNTIRFLVLNLSYEVIDFLFEMQAVDSTIPVIQRIDRSYRNPD